MTVKNGQCLPARKTELERERQFGENIVAN